MPYADPEKRRAKDRRYYARNRLAIQERERRRYADNRASVRAYQNERIHGLRIAAGWARFWDRQQGRCYLCGDELTPETAVVDHDHDCCPTGRSCEKCRRGLACNACNTIIGLALDDPSRLERIASHLAAVIPATKARIYSGPEQLSLSFPEVS